MDLWTTFEASMFGKTVLGFSYQFILPFLWGMVLGAFFYSFQKVVFPRHVSQPVWWLGFVFRSSVVLWGVFLMVDGGWQRALIAVTAFLWTRISLRRKWKSSTISN